MKKQFFILACVLVIVAIGFVLYALGHPELSFSWSTQMTYIFYGVYADIVVLLFVLAFWKKKSRLYVLAVILELGAIFFSCAVHAHRFTGGRIQLVFADGVGT
ncbi:hypothetical protein [Blautia obeum]|uniref:hypothetical protein n=1 Tax=Blautia obeum TaxID=40520 RepID=UPI003D057A59